MNEITTVPDSVSNAGYTFNYALWTAGTVVTLVNAPWDSDYVKKYRPSQKFSASTIRDKVVDSLWGKILIYDLPKIPLHQELQLKIQKVDVNAKAELNLYLAP